MRIEKQLIEFSDTGYFSDIFIDYISSNKKLQPLYQYIPSPVSFQQAIINLQKQSFNRKLLVEVITQQYSNLQPSVSSASNLQLLLNEKTFTVCTGHQLCLFTGPLYFIYKIITTINLAEELKKNYPEYNFVPIYWMASEDHDFDEVNHINVFGKNIKWSNENHRQSAVGKLKTDSIKNVIEELRPIVGENENAKALLNLFSRAYLENKNLADATRFLVNELFGKHGLVIIDANDKRLKNEFSSVLKDDILNCTNYKLINSTITQMSDAGYKAQVNPREINVFYMTNSLRERIVKDNDDFRVNNSDLKFSKEILTKEIEQYPERFSPNVVLRPLYQQKILPNLAYVGGPGEIAYWLEYKTMFQHHQIQFPILISRNSVMWMDENTSDQIKKLGLTAEDLFKPIDTLIKDFINKNAAIQISLNEEEKKLQLIYQDIASKAEKIDPTLKPAVEAELKKQLNTLKTIENKIIRAEKQKHENSVNKIKKLKEKLFPNNELQERQENFIPFYLKYGEDFIRELKKQLHPFISKFHLIKES